MSTHNAAHDHGRGDRDRDDLDRKTIAARKEQWLSDKGVEPDVPHTTWSDISAAEHGEHVDGLLWEIDGDLRRMPASLEWGPL